MRWIYLFAIIASLLLSGCSALGPALESVPAVQEEVESVDSAAVLATPIKIATVKSVQIVIDPTATPLLATETVAAPVATATIADKMIEAGGIANADVIYVSARLVGTDTWSFAVTVQHPDTGWEDYADGWDIVLPDGTVLKPDPESPFTRLLLHPHESEQPFTRSQGNIRIADDIKFVTVRAHDLVDGFGGKEIVVDLTVESSQEFDVSR